MKVLIISLLQFGQGIRFRSDDAGCPPVGGSALVGETGCTPIGGSVLVDLAALDNTS